MRGLRWRCFRTEIMQCHWSAVEETDCIHFWGSCTEGLCITTGCNSVGERVRTRQRSYNEGLDAIDVMLCSNDNESAIMAEECINATIPAECLP